MSGCLSGRPLMYMKTPPGLFRTAFFAGRSALFFDSFTRPYARDDIGADRRDD